MRHCRVRSSSERSAQVALAWLHRWRWWLYGILFGVMSWMGIDRVSTWILIGPFLVALVWVPAVIRDNGIVKRSGAEFKAGMRGD